MDDLCINRFGMHWLYCSGKKHYTPILLDAYTSTPASGNTLTDNRHWSFATQTIPGEVP